MEEDPHQEDPLKMPPQGFQEIARFLTGDDSLRMTTSIPPEWMPPGLVVGSTVAVMTSRQIHQDKRTGATYMSTMMTSVGLMYLGTPLKAATGQMVIIEDITNANMADDHSD